MGKRRKVASLLLIVLLMLPLTGCYDRVELEGMAFIVSLGLDKGPDNTIDVTARLAVPSKLAGGAGGAGGGGGGGGKEDVVSGAKPITVRARTVSEALNLLNTAVERRVSLLHLANFVIGESLAKEGVIEYLRPLTRYREFRRTVAVFVIPGNVRAAYESNHPLLEQSITRFTESLTDVSRHTGLSAPQKLHEFLVSLETPNEDPIAPMLVVNSKVQQQAKQSDGASSQTESMADVPTFEPGNVVRIGGNPVESIGTAIFKNDKLVTTLDGIETRMLLMIRGELLRTQMDFTDPKQAGKVVNLEIKHSRPPLIQVDLNANPVRIDIKQNLEADLIGVQGELDYTQPKNLAILEKAICETLETRQEKLITRVYHDYQADPFHIFRSVRGQFVTYDEIKNFPYRDKLKDAKVNVTVDLQIRRSGAQLTPIEAK